LKNYLFRFFIRKNVILDLKQMDLVITDSSHSVQITNYVNQINIETAKVLKCITITKDYS